MVRLCAYFGLNHKSTFSRTCFLLDTSSHLGMRLVHQFLIILISGFLGSFQTFCHVRVPCEILDVQHHPRVCLDRLMNKASMLIVRKFLSMLDTCCQTGTDYRKNSATTCLD